MEYCPPVRARPVEVGTIVACLDPVGRGAWDFCACTRATHTRNTGLARLGGATHR